MGEVVPFVPRHAATRKPMVEAEQTPSLSLDSPIDVLYETTLGFAHMPSDLPIGTMLRIKLPADYVAPESDPA